MFGRVCQAAAPVGGRAVHTEGEVCYPDCLLTCSSSASFSQYHHFALRRVDQYGNTTIALPPLISWPREITNCRKTISYFKAHLTLRHVSAVSDKVSV